MTRYALHVTTLTDEPAANERARIIRRYLPENYTALVVPHGDYDTYTIVIMGQDVAGWTLDGYVLPRLASGWYSAREVTPAEAHDFWPLPTEYHPLG